MKLRLKLLMSREIIEINFTEGNTVGDIQQIVFLKTGILTDCQRFYRKGVVLSESEPLISTGNDSSVGCLYFAVLGFSCESELSHLQLFASYSYAKILRMSSDVASALSSIIQGKTRSARFNAPNVQKYWDSIDTLPPRISILNRIEGIDDFANSLIISEQSKNSNANTGASMGK